MTAAEAYREALVRLTGAGIVREEARVMARLVLERTLRLTHPHLLAPERELAPAEEAAWEQAIALLSTGYPLPYWRGEWEFDGLQLLCDERALIPRPETELLVEAAVHRLQAIESPLVADLGTGSGAIALAVAKRLPEARVWATDLSPPALALAAENARQTGLEESVTFLAGAAEDWAGPLLEAGLRGQLHAVLCNPPYIGVRDWEHLPVSLKEYEPRLALTDEADGQAAFRGLASQCGALLRREGFLAAEVAFGQAETVAEIFTAAGWQVTAVRRDLAGIERVLIVEPGYNEGAT